MFDCKRAAVFDGDGDCVRAGVHDGGGAEVRGAVHDQVRAAVQHNQRTGKYKSVDGTFQERHSHVI